MADPTMQQARGFLQRNIDYIEKQVYQRKYGRIRFRNLMPIDSSPDAWTAQVTRYTSDMTGRAQFFEAGGDDVPRANVSKAQLQFPIYSAAMGYEYNLDELRTSMMLKERLTADKAMAARRAAEEFLDDLALNGDSTRSIDGLFNASDVTNVDAADGSGGESTWSSKTGAEILKDINDAISTVYVNTRQTEIPNMVLLPINQYLILANTLWDDAKERTLMMSLRDANVYTAETGQPLTIRSVRGLETAAGSNKARMIVYSNAPDVLRFMMPMPFMFLPLFQASPMTWKVDGLMRVGGLDVRLPKAMRYIDGI